MNKKRILSIFIVFIMLFSFLIPSIAGKNDSLIKIHDWTGLYNIRNNLSADYILVKDLNEKSPGYSLYAGSSADGGKGWLPIGDVSAPFTGSFNGNSKSISGLFINRPESDYIGLFGDITDGRIYDLTMDNLNIIGRDYVGSISGNISGSSKYDPPSSLSNCTVSGVVKGERIIGGLVGGMGTYSPVVISSSSASVDVIGYTNDSEIIEQNVGGLVGYSLRAGLIIDCNSTGNITGNRDNIGGLVGRVDYDESRIDNCYSTGNISGQNYVGGLVGNADVYLSGAIVTNSYTIGNVMGLDYIGGLVGSGRGIDITNCHTSGNVVGTTSVGGLCGYIYRGSNIIDCYSLGSVEGVSTVGGLVGLISSSEIMRSYTKCQVSGSTSIGGIVGGLSSGTYGGSSIVDSYSLSNIFGNSAVGGVAGTGLILIQDSPSSLVRVYAAGRVNGSEYVEGLVGILVADQENPDISEIYNYNYWDTEATGQTNPVLIGTGLTTDEMVQMSSFSGWDFENVWTIEEGLSYPYLRWQGDVNIPYVGDAQINNPSVIVTTDQTTYIRYNIVNIEATVSDSLGLPVVGSTLKITIVEPRKGSVVLSQELETNSEGKVFTTFEILRTTTKGTYSVTAEIVGTEVKHTCYFEVK